LKEQTNNFTKTSPKTILPLHDGIVTCTKNINLKFMEQITIPSLSSIRNLIEPINWRLQQIEEKLQKLPKMVNPSKYYRNSDLKQLFGLSNNTIIKYRENGTLPYTRIGEVYLYEVDEINKILKRNEVKL
jgi:hypothetical protein